MEKIIQTPSYWMNPEYQPFAETETVYGNRVKIPERWLVSLECLELVPSVQDKVKILRATIKSRGYQAADLARVLMEEY